MEVLACIISDYPTYRYYAAESIDLLGLSCICRELLPKRIALAIASIYVKKVWKYSKFSLQCCTDDILDISPLSILV